MGGCQSNDRPGGHEVTFQDNGNGTAGRRDKHLNASKMKSLIRVGSQVVRSVGAPDPATGRKKYAAARASTYDHVHEVVLSNFDELDVKRKAGVVGLRNLGNSCFMNSSLQCLSNTIPLTDYFLGYDYKKEINYDNVLGSKGELVASYAALVKEMWLGNQKTVKPSAFKSRLAKFAPQFEGYEQQDSQEMLSCLLDGVHEDLNRVKKKPYIEDKDCDGSNDEGDAILAWQNYLQRDRSVVVDLFQGQLRNEITCRNADATQSDGSAGCGHRNIKFEPFMYLSVPLSDSCQSLDDCLDLFCAEESLTGDNQWYCTKCKTHVDATKRFDLWMLPPILIVHLKRFKFMSDGSRCKIEQPVQYPVSGWDLSRGMQGTRGGVHPSYDLYAVSNHSGGTLGFGHYTAMALDRFDEEWYEFNDSSCQRVGPNSGLGFSSSCYLMFYNRVEENKEDKSDPACSERSTREPIVRRQEVDRPELWPHMQIRQKDYRSFTRSVKNLSSTLEKPSSVCTGSSKL
mmetsp:Transcript_26939/g.58892  ORF Transcript_26939/g.58892 Transcript_26939/m.58892 type:complete len:512 (-) Transcript_26939:53-1588(-)